MARSITRSTLVTGPDAAPVLLDYLRDPANVALAVTIAGGTATYAVEFTLDDKDDFTTQASYQINATWFLVPGMTWSANATGVLNTPARAVRLNCSAIAGGAVVTMTVLQAGIS
jgi:hypothetical protein